MVSHRCPACGHVLDATLPVAPSADGAAFLALLPSAPDGLTCPEVTRLLGWPRARAGRAVKASNNLYRLGLATIEFGQGGRVRISPRGRAWLALNAPESRKPPPGAADEESSRDGATIPSAEPSARPEQLNQKLAR